MKLKSLAIGMMAMGAVFATGCASVTSPVGYAGIFTSVNGPVALTENVGSRKTGEACASNVLGLFASGDASIDKARRNGEIAKISTVDHSSLSVLFIYSKYCTIVKGE
ncbi:MAG: hypothetical protein ACI9OO_000619 [Bacteroidia bacterium]|jgi:hypothetical protein